MRTAGILLTGAAGGVVLGTVLGVHGITGGAVFCVCCFLAGGLILWDKGRAEHE